MLFLNHADSLQLQNNKRELAKAALSGEATKNMKLTMNDIMGALIILWLYQ